MQDIAQFPVAADHGGGQTGQVGAGDAHALKVHTDQLLCTHGLGKAGGHIIAVPAVQKLYPVDLPRPQGGEAGCRSHQVVPHLPGGDILQRQLPGPQPALLHRHDAEPDGRCPQRVLVQHPFHDLLQRGHVHAAFLYHPAQKLVQGGKVGVFLRQLHHIPAADGQPHIPGSLVQIQHEHGAVQPAHAGAGDDLRVPVQLHQSPPDAHLIAAPRAAACQHQRLLRGISAFHIKPSRARSRYFQHCYNYTILLGKILPFFRG